MIATHVSHFGLEIVQKTETSVILSGTKANCLRMAAALGLHALRYEGRTVSIDGGEAVMAPAGRDDFVWCHFAEGGFILRGRDDYSLLVRRSDWDAA